ncbi:MAG: DEAD/DEAH box helicase family protein [Elusimicrobia bacterium]|nr:DEAD/DEAH box helicase family protein [Elusimicrobiota bacterium]
MGELYGRLTRANGSKEAGWMGEMKPGDLVQRDRSVSLFDPSRPALTQKPEGVQVTEALQKFDRGVFEAKVAEVHLTVAKAQVINNDPKSYSKVEVKAAEVLLAKVESLRLAEKTAKAEYLAAADNAKKETTPLNQAIADLKKAEHQVLEGGLNALVLPGAKLNILQGFYEGLVVRRQAAFQKYQLEAEKSGIEKEVRSATSGDAVAAAVAKAQGPVPVGEISIVGKMDGRRLEVLKEHALAYVEDVFSIRKAQNKGPMSQASFDRMTKEMVVKYEMLSELAKNERDGQLDPDTVAKIRKELGGTLWQAKAMELKGVSKADADSLVAYGEFIKSKISEVLGKSIGQVDSVVKAEVESALKDFARAKKDGSDIPLPLYDFSIQSFLQERGIQAEKGGVVDHLQALEQVLERYGSNKFYPDQYLALNSLLMGNHIEMEAGAGKTEIAIAYQILMAKTHGARYSGVVVVDSEIAAQKFLERAFLGIKTGPEGNRRELSGKDFAKEFGIELVNGTAMFQERDLKGLVEKLRDPNALVVIDYASFGHLHNSAGAEGGEVGRALRQINNIVVDEVHVAVSGNQAYIRGGEGTPLGASAEGRARVDRVESLLNAVLSLKAEEITTDMRDVSGSDPKAKVWLSENGRGFGVSEGFRKELETIGYKDHEISSVLRALTDRNKEGQRDGGFSVVDGKVISLDGYGSIMFNTRNNDVNHQIALGLILNRAVEFKLAGGAVRIEDLKSEQKIWSRLGTVEVLAIEEAKTDGHTSLLEIFYKPNATVVGMTATAEGRKTLIGMGLGGEIVSISGSRFDPKEINLVTGLQEGVKGVADWLSEHMLSALERRTNSSDANWNPHENLDGIFASPSRSARDQIFKMLVDRAESSQSSEIKVQVDGKIKTFESVILKVRDAKGALREVELVRIEPETFNVSDKHFLNELAKSVALDNSSRPRLVMMNEQAFTGTDFQGRYRMAVYDPEATMTETLYAQLLNRIGRTIPNADMQMGHTRWESEKQKFVLVDNLSSDAANAKLGALSPQERASLRSLWSEGGYKNPEASGLLERAPNGSKVGQLSELETLSLLAKYNEATDRSQATERVVSDTLRGRLLIMNMKGLLEDPWIGGQDKAKVDAALTRIINQGPSGVGIVPRDGILTPEQIVLRLWSNASREALQEFKGLRANMRDERSLAIVDGFIKNIETANKEFGTKTLGSVNAVRVEKGQQKVGSLNKAETVLELAMVAKEMAHDLVARKESDGSANLDRTVQQVSQAVTAARGREVTVSESSVLEQQLGSFASDQIRGPSARLAGTLQGMIGVGSNIALSNALGVLASGTFNGDSVDSLSDQDIVGKVYDLGMGLDNDQQRDVLAMALNPTLNWQELSRVNGGYLILGQDANLAKAADFKLVSRADGVQQILKENTGIQRWTAVPLAYARAFFSSFRGEKISGRAALATNEYLLGDTSWRGSFRFPVAKSDRALAMKIMSGDRQASVPQINALVAAFGGSDHSKQQAVRAALLGVTSQKWDKAMGVYNQEVSFIKSQDEALSARAASSLQMADVLSPSFENGAVRAQVLQSRLETAPASDALWKSFRFTTTAAGTLGGLAAAFGGLGIVTSLFGLAAGLMAMSNPKEPTDKENGVMRMLRDQGNNPWVQIGTLGFGLVGLGVVPVAAIAATLVVSLPLLAKKYGVELGNRRLDAGFLFGGMGTPSANSNLQRMNAAESRVGALRVFELETKEGRTWLGHYFPQIEEAERRHGDLANFQMIREGVTYQELVGLSDGEWATVKANAVLVGGEEFVEARSQVRFSDLKETAKIQAMVTKTVVSQDTPLPLPAEEREGLKFGAQDNLEQLTYDQLIEKGKGLVKQITATMTEMAEMDKMDEIDPNKAVILRDKGVVLRGLTVSLDAINKRAKLLKTQPTSVPVLSPREEDDVRFGDYLSALGSVTEFTDLSGEGLDPTLVMNEFKDFSSNAVSSGVEVDSDAGQTVGVKAAALSVAGQAWAGVVSAGVSLAGVTGVAFAGMTLGAAPLAVLGVAGGLSAAYYLANWSREIGASRLNSGAPTAWVDDGDHTIRVSWERFAGLMETKWMGWLNPLGKNSVGASVLWHEQSHRLLGAGEMGAALAQVMPTFVSLAYSAVRSVQSLAKGGEAKLLLVSGEETQAMLGALENRSAMEGLAGLAAAARTSGVETVGQVIFKVTATGVDVATVRGITDGVRADANQAVVEQAGIAPAALSLWAHVHVGLASLTDKKTGMPIPSVTDLLNPAGIVMDTANNMTSYKWVATREGLMVQLSSKGAAESEFGAPVNKPLGQWLVEALDRGESIPLDGRNGALLGALVEAGMKEMGAIDEGTKLTLEQIHELEGKLAREVGGAVNRLNLQSATAGYVRAYFNAQAEKPRAYVGALADIEKVNGTAREVLSAWGMSPFVPVTRGEVEGQITTVRAEDVVSQTLNREMAAELIEALSVGNGEGSLKVLNATANQVLAPVYRGYLGYGLSGRISVERRVGGEGLSEMRIGTKGDIRILLPLSRKGEADPTAKAAELLALVNLEMAEAAIYSGMAELSELEGRARSDIEALSVALSQRAAESAGWTALAGAGMRIFLKDSLASDLKRVDAQRLALSLLDQVVRETKDGDQRAETVRQVVNLAGMGHSLLEMTGAVVFPKVLTIDARSFFTNGKFNEALWKAVSTPKPEMNVLIVDNLDPGENPAEGRRVPLKGTGDEKRPPGGPGGGGSEREDLLGRSDENDPGVVRLGQEHRAHGARGGGDDRQGSLEIPERDHPRGVGG